LAHLKGRRLRQWLTGAAGCRLLQARMLRTNTVTLTKEQAQAVVAKAGWDGGKLVKELCSGASVGVEFGGSQGMEEVTEMAQSAGALLTESVDAAAEYRYLGVEG